MDDRSLGVRLLGKSERAAMRAHAIRRIATGELSDTERIALLAEVTGMTGVEAAGVLGLSDDDGDEIGT